MTNVCTNFDTWGQTQHSTLRKNALFPKWIFNTYNCAHEVWKEVHLIDTSYWVAFKEIETSSDQK